MSTSYLIQSIRDGEIQERGTAWFLDENTVVTAFHVVGNTDIGQWSNRRPGLEYQLLLDKDNHIVLEPLVFNESADIALLKPVDAVANINYFTLAEAAPASSDVRWHSKGHPAFHDGALGLHGLLNRGDDKTPARALQLTLDEGTKVDWGGISGSPVWIEQDSDRRPNDQNQSSEGEELRLRQEIEALQQGWDMQSQKLQILRKQNILETRAEEKFRLNSLINQAQTELDQLEQQLRTLENQRKMAVSNVIPQHDQQVITQTQQQVVGLITSVIHEVNIVWAASVAEIRALYQRPLQHKPLVQATTRDDTIQTILQELSRDNLRGIALLEPRRFDASGIVDRVTTKLRESASNTLVVRLVPNPNASDIDYFYGALYRDLKRGLQQILGENYSQEWKNCLEQINDPKGRKVKEMEFQFVLEDLLDGPISKSQQQLILIVEGLSKVPAEQLKMWGWMMQRLRDRPWKILVWGGEELHRLITDKTVRENSVFHELKTTFVESLSKPEVAQLLQNELGLSSGADSLYEITQGHPALVHELLTSASDELRRNDNARLRKRALNSEYLNYYIKPMIENDLSIHAVLQRLQRGETHQQMSTEEDRLRWLGIIKEKDAHHWNWTAPIMVDWLKRWLA